MKNMHLALSALQLAGGFFSCQKSTDVDLSTLHMELEQSPPHKNLSVGMEYQGGIIFKLDESGRHGLIVAKEDLGPAPWGCYGTEIPAAREWDDGYIGSQAILTSCPETGIAARLCDLYLVREKGDKGRKYDDWFMPAFGQLDQIMIALKSASGLCDKSYWVSTEAYGGFQGYPINPANSAWKIAISCAPSNPAVWGKFPAPAPKSGYSWVRPIRRF
jgi:hypothetical protein